MKHLSILCCALLFTEIYTTSVVGGITVTDKERILKTVKPKATLPLKSVAQKGSPLEGTTQDSTRTLHTVGSHEKSNFERKHTMSTTHKPTEGLLSEHRHHRFRLPPVALPGVFRDYDISTGSEKDVKYYNSLNSLRSPYWLQGYPYRSSGFSSSPKGISNMLVRRRKRDLRRLRRDLGMEPDASLSVPYLGSLPYVTQEGIRNEDITDILTGLDILEQLALQTQRQDVPTEKFPDRVFSKPPYHLKSPPSMFAPQPKLFSDQDNQDESRRHPSALEWETMRNAVYGPPDKRFSVPLGIGMSRLPGMKRSFFRELTNQQKSGEGKRPGTFLQNRIPMAAFLGRERYGPLNLQKTAM